MGERDKGGLRGARREEFSGLDADADDLRIFRGRVTGGDADLWKVRGP